jgi:hypothetical protein
MIEDDTSKTTIKLSGLDHEERVCPFNNGPWKKVGDALVFFMFFVTPILFLITLIITG